MSTPIQSTAKPSIRIVGTFTLEPHQGKSDLKSLVDAGNYGTTNEHITPDRFTEEVIGRVDEEVEVVLAESSDGVEPKHILVFADENNFEQPIAGDGMRFGKQYSEEYSKRPVIVPHKPIPGPGGGGILILYEDVSGPILDVGSFEGGWRSGAAFLLRKRKT